MLKKAKILSGVLLLCFSSPLISQAATLDVRGGYRSGSHAYETRLKVSEGWQNGWWASMESNTWNTIHDNKKENAALNDVQVEVNYAIKLDDQWTVRPGMLTHFSSNGTRYGPYVKLSWDATKDLNFGIRYRYDWKAYRQQDLSGDMSRDNVHRWDGSQDDTFMSLTILIVISPSHGKRRYTANRTIIAMQTIRNGRRKMHLFYNTI
ncbi:hypothetical protein EIMP300_84660 [Escherichia coli]|uniref:N-acetylneuraminic acid outer membrane channel NanC n=1 Tax=Escherichia coli TaxID=562 RepID=A0A8S0G2S9_ECOLX|nr:hypothetical protein EIMP300_84660 [Escherichia coli]